MIFCFSSLGTRATVTSLNSRFYQAFTKTLYRDIYISSPLQLVKLVDSPNAARNLAETWRLTMERSVFCRSNWLNIRRVRLRPALYPGRVLQMTTSLREFQVEEGSCRGSLSLDGEEFESQFQTEMFARAFNPSYLPHLARFQSPWTKYLTPLCRGRPIEYLVVGQECSIVINQSLGSFHPAGASPSRVSLDVSVSLDPQESFRPTTHQVAALLEKVSLEGVTVRHLRIVANDWRKHVGLDMGWSTPELPSWVVPIVSKRGHEHLESLCVIFEPPRARDTTAVQLQTLKQVTYHIPNLAYAILGPSNVEWRRCSEKQSESSSRVPDWTPCPNHSDPEILSWWLDRLEPYDAAKAKKGNLEGAGRLRNSMLARWDEALVPSIDVLRMRLSDLGPGSVQG
ncbi:hypothetical protein FRC08_014888 [Ceratobasidium sp. 394]|nr:hypothetical protein FRC08_014888 [Ceratobasidium sp. 394]